MILCCETSAAAPSLLIADAHTGAVILACDYPDSRDFSLDSALVALYQKSGTHPRAVKKFVISLGPGSYTGIRVGLAVLQAYRLALPDLKIFGISLLEVMATMTPPIPQTLTLTVAKSKRQDFYWQIFDGATALTPPQASQSQDIIAAIAALPPAHRTRAITLIGNDAKRFHETTDDNARACLHWNGDEITPNAKDLLAWHWQNPEDGKDNFTPLYLRPAQTSITKFKPA